MQGIRNIETININHVIIDLNDNVPPHYIYWHNSFATKPQGAGAGGFPRSNEAKEEMKTWSCPCNAN